MIERGDLIASRRGTLHRAAGEDVHTENGERSKMMCGALLAGVRHPFNRYTSDDADDLCDHCFGTSPLNPYQHPDGYRYYQSSYTVDGKQVRPTIHEHQLVFLLHEPDECDDPACDCSCPPECDLDCDFACPYKIFSNGVWQLHHGPIEGDEDDDVPRSPRKWANWTGNLRLMPDDAHARETYRTTLADRKSPESAAASD